MFDDYKIAVRNFYLEKKSKFQLSSNLENLRRDNLRKECVAVFLKKNSKEDKVFIQSFFDPTNRYSDQVRSIEKFNLDKFRPLITFLNDGKNIRDEESIKLLAWLINFPSYERWRDGEIIIEPNTEGNDKINPDLTTTPEVILDESEKPIFATNSLTKPDLPNEKSTILKFKNVAIYFTIFIFSFSTAYWFYNDSIIGSTFRNLFLSGEEKCMHWLGDRYVPIVCNEKGSETPIIPINPQKLNHFKKINLPDTLTKNSIGKVWYLNVNGGRDYFTGSGLHPTNPNEELKPLSTYILYKYSSYYRYLLNRLIWSICFAAFVTFASLILYRYLPKFLKDLFFKPL